MQNRCVTKLNLESLNRSEGNPNLLAMYLSQKLL